MATTAKAIHPRSRDSMFALGAALAGTAAVWLLLGRLPLVGIDDANITQAYAANLAAGRGYVFNLPGPRVEGATSLLWVALNTLAFLTPRPEWLILILGIASCAAALWLMLRIYRSLRPGASGGEAIGCVLFAAGMMPAFFLWGALTLMEVGLWTALVLGYVLLALEAEGTSGSRRPGAELACLAAMMLCRPEAPAYVAGILACEACTLAGATRERRTRFLRRAAWHLAVVAGFAAAMAAGRMIYFGVPVPNTYYAKVSSRFLDNLASGARYLDDFVRTEPSFFFFFAFAVLGIAWGLRAGANDSAGLARRRLWIVLGAALVVLAIPVFLGGDHFYSFRFYQPAYPLLWCGGLAFAAPALERARAIFGRCPLWIVALFLVVGSVRFFKNHNGVNYEFELAVRGRDYGQALNGISATEPPSIAVIAAGGIRRTYRGPIDDLLGLNWPEMARANGRRTGMRNHAGYDNDVFWRHPSDLILTLTDVPDPKHINVWLPAPMFTADPRFDSKYEAVVLSLGEHQHLVFVARDALGKLAALKPVEIPWQAISYTFGR